jgi:CheY-like chemotaxis protein
VVETPTPPWRILVIDDEPAVQLVLERLFTRMGQKTRRAVNGPEGTAVLGAEGWDLVLIDKNLPEGNGLELAKAARAANSNAVIILITGYASRESADALVGVVDEYLTKPFELAQLRDVIGTLMAMRAQGRKLSVPRSSGSGLRAPASSPPRPRAVHLDSVHIVVADAREEAFLLAAARQTGFSATSGPITERTEAEVFIVDGRSALLEVRKAVWHRQASNPAFEVVMLVDVQAMSDSAAAVALKATRRVPRPLTAEGAVALLARLRD